MNISDKVYVGMAVLLLLVSGVGVLLSQGYLLPSITSQTQTYPLEHTADRNHTWENRAPSTCPALADNIRRERTGDDSLFVSFNGSGAATSVDTVSSRSEAENAVTAFLTEHQDCFDVAPDSIRLQNHNTRQGNWNLHYDQYYQNLPVFFARVIVDVTEDGNVRAVRTRKYWHNLTAPTIPEISKFSATRTARQETGLDTPVEETQLGIYYDHLAWKIRLEPDDMTKKNLLYIDAVTGDVLWQSQTYTTLN